MQSEVETTHSSGTKERWRLKRGILNICSSWIKFHGCSWWEHTKTTNTLPLQRWNAHTTHLLRLKESFCLDFVFFKLNPDAESHIFSKCLPLAHCSSENRQCTSLLPNAMKDSGHAAGLFTTIHLLLSVHRLWVQRTPEQGLRTPRNIIWNWKTEQGDKNTWFNHLNENTSYTRWPVFELNNDEGVKPLKRGHSHRLITRCSSTALDLLQLSRGRHQYSCCRIFAQYSLDEWLRNDCSIQRLAAVYHYIK